MQDATLAHAPRRTQDRVRFAELVSPLALDVALCAALLVLALAVRLPGLVEFPPFTDEFAEATRAHEILRGDRYYLINGIAYLGAFHTYLVAGAYALFGPSIVVARAVTLAFSVLLVAVTYWLARELRLSRPLAFLAAALLVTSGAHIVVGSHVAWANCTTPLYTTLTVLLLLRAVRLERPWLLVATSFVGGLSLQSHISVLPLLLAVAAYGLRQSRVRSWLRGRWLPLVVLAFLVAYSPLLIYNAQTGMDSVDAVMDQSEDYQDRQELTPAVYLDNVQALLVGYGQIVASSFVPQEEALADPAFFVASALALAGLAWAAWRGFWLPALAVVLTALSLPLLNPKYNLVMNGRYLMPLLPLVVVTQAMALGAFLSWARPRLAAEATSERSRRLVAGAAAVVVAALVAWTLLNPLQRTYAYQQELMPYNRPLVTVVDRVMAARAPGEAVFVDFKLSVRRSALHFPQGRSLRALLSLAGVHPQAAVPEDMGKLMDPGAKSVLLITMNDRKIDESLVANPLNVSWDPPEPFQSIRVYRLRRP